MPFRRIVAVKFPVRRAAGLAFLALLTGGAPAPTVTPSDARPKGSLMIVGGGERSGAMMRRFVELAGGSGRARIAVVPMASEEAAESGAETASELDSLGAHTFVFLVDRAQADAPEFVRRLDSATGIWFCGGDQARLTDVIGGTASLRAIQARYQAGAVVGGTSAGAAIMSDSMITGDQTPPGDTTGYYGDEYPSIERHRIEVRPGLGFLHGAIVDQHFLKRERHNRLLSAVLERPGLVGVGIDESTAIEVSPDGRWHVLGESDVIVYDARHARVTAPGAPLLGATDIRVHLLPSGSVYDPASGRAGLAAR
jgi:cyanophycinase